jgi:O-methyltransferase involved in polyketide biosynthesis
VAEQSPQDGPTSEAPEIEPDVAHSARVFDYLLGGVTNFEADRQAAAAGAASVGGIDVARASVRSTRVFLGQVVRYLAGEAGIRQFLDVGTGLPTADNTHQVAQAIAPESRIVYTDNDPMVLAHARALLTSTPEGVTDYIDADARDTDAILRAAASTLDFSRPVAVMLLGILNFIGDNDEAQRIVDGLMAAVPSGSYLAVAHPTTEVKPEESRQAADTWNQTAKPPITLRSAAEIEAFFHGLELLAPGVVTCTKWRPDPGDPTADTDVYQFCAVGRKP